MAFITVDGQSGFSSDSSVLGRYTKGGSYVVLNKVMGLLVSIKPDTDEEGLKIAIDTCDQIFSTSSGGKGLIRLPEGGFIHRDYIGGVNVANGISVVIQGKENGKTILWLNTPSEAHAKAICIELIRIMNVNGNKVLPKIDWDSLLQEDHETSTIAE